jgi:hypothetical protein
VTEGLDQIRGTLERCPLRKRVQKSEWRRHDTKDESGCPEWAWDSSALIGLVYRVHGEEVLGTRPDGVGSDEDR